MVRSHVHHTLLRRGITKSDNGDAFAKYALPRQIEFRTELPKTLVGKVAYRVLEEEANALEG